jgi:hypothetical protein
MMTRRDALRSMAGIAVAAVLPRDRRALARKPLPHPDPRPGITGEHVLAEEKLPDKRRVRAAYEAARTHPQIFDGIHCPCECQDSMHHRSLLSCFESAQPTGCHGCRETAEFIEPLAKQGKTLAEIREAVDRKFG